MIRIFIESKKPETSEYNFLSTYIISSMKSLSNTKWKKLGNGEWQFDNPNYWNLDAAYLQPLKDFLYNHFKESK